MSTWMGYVKLYALTVPVFFAVDMVWLGLVAKTFYRTRLGNLLRPDVNWPAALAFYLVYIAGILLFAVVPNLDRGALGRCMLWGAMFGFFTYATYDLTNLATLKQWPVSVAIVDILWGVVLCTAVSASSYTIGRWLG